MRVGKTITAALLAVGLVTAAPAAAHGGGGPGGHRAGSEYGGKVPSRITTRLKRANNSLDRATGYIDDGKASSAAASLKSVTSNLSAAEKSAKRGLSGTNGPAGAGAVADAQDNVIGTLTGLFDGADDDTTTAVATALDATITQRDDLVAAIAALPAADQAKYYDVLDAISSATADELDSIDQALTDDTLTTAGTAALNSAKTKITATQTAVQALVTALDAADTGSAQNASDTSAADGQPCDGQRGSSGTGSGNSTTARSSGNARGV
jgi:hypothetical protein